MHIPVWARREKTAKQKTAGTFAPGDIAYCATCKCYCGIIKNFTLFAGQRFICFDCLGDKAMQLQKEHCTQ